MNSEMSVKLAKCSWGLTYENDAEVVGDGR